MLTPMTENAADAVVNNIVAACEDISKLKTSGYIYIYLASGFIAHYNRQGFMGHYRGYSLRHDVLRNQSANQFNSFRPGEKHYAYYKQRADIYNHICRRLNQ